MQVVEDVVLLNPGFPTSTSGGHTWSHLLAEEVVDDLARAVTAVPVRLDFLYDSIALGAQHVDEARTRRREAATFHMRVAEVVPEDVGHDDVFGDEGGQNGG